MSNSKMKLVEECADNLGLTVAELLSIAATAPRRYFVWQIKKRNGGNRTVCQPARELRPVQQYFLDHVINKSLVHPSATAYVKGSSIKRNALMHSNSRVILKLDFENFFNSLLVADWYKYAAAHFPHWSPLELDFSAKILFWGIKSYSPVCLAIGAPTSPKLSNILMFDIDQQLHSFASSDNITYSRYADDITFSTAGYLDVEKCISIVQQALKQAKYTNIRLNKPKTKLISNRFQRRVTGLILTPNNLVSIGRDRKRLISAMCHHFVHYRMTQTELVRLAGLIAFANDIEPDFVNMLRRKYGTINLDKISNWKSAKID